MLHKIKNFSRTGNITWCPGREVLHWVLKAAVPTETHVPIMPLDVVFASRSAWQPFQPCLTSVRGALPIALRSPRVPASHARSPTPRPFPGCDAHTQAAAEAGGEPAVPYGCSTPVDPPASGSGWRSHRHLPAKQPECSHSLFSKGPPLNNWIFILVCLAGNNVARVT